MEFVYKLDKGSKKFECPNCGKKTFVRYVDANGNYADGKFGRCDREVNCGYILIPSDKEKSVFIPKPKVVIPPSLVPFEDAENTFANYEKNSLCKWLIKKLGIENFNKILDMYQFGVYENFYDWIIFWQIDINMNCRSGKVIKYGNDGKRYKSQMPNWFHRLMKYDDFNLVQCFFGEHLLNTDARKPVAIVESEKTAMIASCFIDKYIWIATGGKGGLNRGKCKVLDGRNVTLFPDLGAYDDWKVKADELGFSISDSLERRATDEQKKLGLDIADFLIK